MASSTNGLPLSQRRKDIFFVAAFSFFAFSSFFSDSWHALGLLEGDAFWSRANRWYGEIAQDHFFMAEHPYTSFNTGVSGLVFGPFYLLLVYALVKGKNWIRPMALVYVGAMLYGCTAWIFYEYSIGPPPGRPLVWWAFNGPYWVIPFLLGVRMWKPYPFN